MSSVLSERQTDDLHNALLDYLHSNGFTKTYEQFKEELPRLVDFDPTANQKSSGLLVKKWTSVIRMQRKIIDLEQRLAQALEENQNIAYLPNGNGKGTDTDWLPQASSVKHRLTGHRDKVNAVAFHPLYSVVASASDDSTVKIWDWESGDLERTLKSHTKRVSGCHYNSTGTTLATCSYDLFVKLWNVENDYQNFATLRGHEHSISSVQFLPGDDKLVSASRDQTLRIWEVSSTHCIKVINPHDNWIRSAIPSIDGRLVVTCSMDHTAKIVETATGEVRAEFRGHENSIDVALIVPAHAVAAIRELVDLKSPQSAPAITDPSLAFAVTGSRDKQIKFWDARGGQCLHTLTGHDNWISALVFHPNGQYLISASDDKTIRVWDLKTGRCTRTIAGVHDAFITSMSWGRQTVSAGDEKRLINVLATSGNDQTVNIWLPKRTG